MTKKYFFLKTSSIVAFVGLATTSGWQLVSCQNPTNDPTLKILDEFDTKDNDNILCHPEDSVTLTVENTNGAEVSWTVTNEEEYEDILSFDDSTAEQLVLTVDADYIIAEVQEVEVIASAGDKSDKIIINIGKLIPVPLTLDYFSFGNEKGENDMIEGFSDGVLTNPSLLDGFNALDFSNQNNIKYVAFYCTFSTNNVIEDWKVGLINFGNLIFLNDNDGYTGKHLFAEITFNSLYRLDFGTSTWANENTSWSVCETFVVSDFPNLKELVMNKANFACEGMAPDEGEILTAYATFAGATMNKLKELDLSNAAFAVPLMSNKVNLIFIQRQRLLLIQTFLR